MLTDELSSKLAGGESANTNSMAEQLLNSLNTGSDYRHAFIEEAIRSRITAQIHALRTKKGWDYKAFAQEMGKKVSWAYRLEDPNQPPPTIPTLLEVAAVYDVGLDVRFCPFSEIIRDISDLSPDSFVVPSFHDGLASNSFTSKKDLADNQIVQHTVINMPWPQAKISTYFMLANLVIHQALNGNIFVPDHVMPPRPDPNDPNNAHIGKRTVEYLGWIHDQIFGSSPYIPPTVTAGDDPKQEG
jgi:transcriptional regulator with XRE-family HTH domain